MSNGKIVLDSGIVCREEFKNREFDEIVLLGGVREVLDGAFAYNRNLEYLSLGDGISSIREGAFSFCGCDLGFSVSVPGSVREIGKKAFYNSVIDRLDLGDGIEIIGDYAFGECDIREVYIPSSVKYIGVGAFWYQHHYEKVRYGDYFDDYRILGVSSLRRVVFNEGLLSIGDFAFSQNDILEVVIPRSVRYIGVGAFRGCNLKRVYMYSDSYLNDISFSDRVKIFGDVQYVIVSLGEVDSEKRLCRKR